MSPGSTTESYPVFARIGLRENLGKNLNQVTWPDRDSNPGHLVSRPDALIVIPQDGLVDGNLLFVRNQLDDTDELSGRVESEFEEEENAATGNSWSFEGVSTIINEGRERCSPVQLMRSLVHSQTLGSSLGCFSLQIYDCSFTGRSCATSGPDTKLPSLPRGSSVTGLNPSAASGSVVNLPRHAPARLPACLPAPLGVKKQVTHFDIGCHARIPTRNTILRWVASFRITGSTSKKKSPGRNSIALRLSEATVRSRALRLLSLGPFEGDALEGMVNGRRVRDRRRYQMIDDIQIYGSYEETKRKADDREEDWRMLGLQPAQPQNSTPQLLLYTSSQRLCADLYQLASCSDSFHGTMIVHWVILRTVVADRVSGYPESAEGYGLSYHGDKLRLPLDARISFRRPSSVLCHMQT
ncbi:hypothetical protein ANN_07238 [Periplaneta americana]|uniref:Uncharacterized protein n=1 Tax=Periplaneta americana TaxID=6978 RepID=A0ABQ8TGN6_PERAM|nr:hypothetical protein ANN_07238 [Periplaneta americana]